MIKLVGNAIWRGGEKIGWIEDNHVFNHDGQKIGAFEENFVYNEEGKKVAYIEGDFLYSEGGGEDAKTPLEKISEDVTGGVVEEITRAAIFVLLGS